MIPLPLLLIHKTAALVLLAGTLHAQDAAPADRNAANSTALPTDMRADSPVKFPEQGALPAKYPEDVKTQGWPSEKDYFLFSSPGRSLAQIAAIQQEMPSGEFTPPANDWKHLARTRKILTEGGDLQLMAVGDSIVNDTMRSGWVAKLQEAYPKSKIKATVYVRGGGGCHHYKEEGRVEKFIVPAKPDVVLIGGISQKDMASIREVIGQIRAGLPDVEFLLITGAFGSTDPRNTEALAKAPHSGTGAYGEALKKLAEEERCAFLDLTTPWRDYILSSKRHPHLFYRDIVHANEHGEQILSKVLMSFWNPSKPKTTGHHTAPPAGAPEFFPGETREVVPETRALVIEVDAEESPSLLHARHIWYSWGLWGCNNERYVQGIVTFQAVALSGEKP